MVCFPVVLQIDLQGKRLGCFITGGRLRRPLFLCMFYPHDQVENYFFLKRLLSNKYLSSFTKIELVIITFFFAKNIH